MGVSTRWTVQILKLLRINGLWLSLTTIQASKWKVTDRHSFQAIESVSKTQRGLANHADQSCQQERPKSTLSDKLATQV